MSELPQGVTVLLPVFNEAEHIDTCLESIAAQDYAGGLEIVVADGGSTDGTVDKLRSWESGDPRVRVIDNPHRVQSEGLNLAAAAASGDILVRADAHSVYAPDYVHRSVETLLETGAVAVGGVMRPEGTTPFGKAVSRAMSSPLTIGAGRFHFATERAEVDTVYLGAFRHQDFLAVGGYRAFPSGVAEDADLYFRWRQLGRKVILEPSIRSTYRPRESLRALLRQYLRYGQGKAEMLYANDRWPSWRPLGPLALVLGLMASGVAATVTPWQWPLVALMAAWLLFLGAVAIPLGRLAPRVILVAAIMHVGYGLGSVWGLLRGPGAVHHLRQPSRASN